MGASAVAPVVTDGPSGEGEGYEELGEREAPEPTRESVEAMSGGEPLQEAPDEKPEEEYQECKTGPFHYKPKPEELEHHRLHHHPYRSWCRWCIEGKAQGEHHQSSKRESTVPVVAGDYFYLTNGKSAEEGWSMASRTELNLKDDEVDQKRRDGQLVKCLIIRCHSSKAIFCWVVPYKGGDGEGGYVTGLIVTALRWLAWTRMILKSDNEPALLQLMRTAAGWAKVELQEIDQLGEEHPTAYDS